jgi:hypothetical protein
MLQVNDETWEENGNLKIDLHRIYRHIPRNLAMTPVLQRIKDVWMAATCLPGAVLARF